MITSHRSFISKSVEGAATQLAGTVAFDSNNLDFIYGYSVLGHGCKDYDLSKGEIKWGKNESMMLIQ